MVHARKLSDLLCCFFLQALEHGAEAAESDEEDNEQPADPTYVQEQQDLKRSFLQVW